MILQRVEQSEWLSNAYLLGDRATVSRLTSVTGGWAFTISRTSGNDRTGSRISGIERSP